MGIQKVSAIDISIINLIRNGFLFLFNGLDSIHTESTVHVATTLFCISLVKAVLGEWH